MTSAHKACIISHCILDLRKSACPLVHVCGGLVRFQELTKARLLPLPLASVLLHLFLCTQLIGAYSPVCCILFLPACLPASLPLSGPLSLPLQYFREDLLPEAGPECPRGHCAGDSLHCRVLHAHTHTHTHTRTPVESHLPT